MGVGGSTEQTLPIFLSACEKIAAIPEKPGATYIWPPSSSGPDQQWLLPLAPLLFSLWLSFPSFRPGKDQRPSEHRNGMSAGHRLGPGRAAEVALLEGREMPRGAPPLPLPLRKKHIAIHWMMTCPVILPLFIVPARHFVLSF